MKTLWVLGLLLLAGHFDIAAQSFYASRRPRSLILVAGTGSSTYFGELANPGDYFDARPNLTVGLQYYVTQRIGLRSEASWFQIAGADSESSTTGRIPRNLSFRSNNFEINLTGLINALPNGLRFYQRPGFNVYGFGGVGFLYFNPTTEYQGTRYALRPLQTELVSYSRAVLVIPFGMGARFKLGPMFNIALEGGYRKTFTDYLDDVSTVHFDASRFTDPVAAALSDRRPELGLSRVEEGTKRGNPATDDGYFLANVKIEYYLPTNFLVRNKLYSKKRKNYGGKPNRRPLYQKRR